MNYVRVNSDVNGNPRYVFHFFNFLNEEELNNTPQGLSRVSQLYDLAVCKAREIGGKRYRGKDFGGGIVLQSDNIDDTIEEIKKIQRM